MKLVNAAEMPDETKPRLKLHVENSAPNPDRPRLSEKSEQRLAEVDRKSAVMYAEMEEDTYCIQRLAERFKAVK